MKRGLRALGGALVVCGVAALVWTLVVWRWQDPFSAVYTKIQQDRLARAYDERVAAYDGRRLKERSLAALRRAVAEEARSYRLATHRGQPLGRIAVPRLGLDMVVVEGTDDASLRKGPGRDRRTSAPGEGGLVYIAGHRTTFLAPFAEIEDLRRGDRVTVEMPYATFVYRITGHRIVAADALSVLRSPGHELLALQACHPRFFASHRYIAYARPIRVLPRNAVAYTPSGASAMLDG